MERETRPPPASEPPNGGWGSRYREVGVDLEAAARAVDLIAEVAHGATRPEVEASVGGFAGLFRLDDRRLLAAATDGVGTKVEVARLAGRLDTVGIDLVAMCVNDLVCTGAEPLFFLDYVALGRVVPEEVRHLVTGVAEGCRRAGCALLGGETAEHPGLLEPGRFDLAGFAVGLVERDALLGPHRVRDGDALLGLPSTGLHSNGFSLVRRVLLAEGGVSLDRDPGGLGRPLADALLEPTAIYVRPVLALARAGLVSAAAHVTGGGLVENVPRMLPDGLGAILDPGTWSVPPIVDVVGRAGALSAEELRSVFNVGLGMVLAVAPEDARAARDLLREEGVEAPAVGRVAAGGGVRFVG